MKRGSHDTKFLILLHSLTPNMFGITTHQPCKPRYNKLGAANANVCSLLNYRINPRKMHEQCVRHPMHQQKILSYNTLITGLPRTYVTKRFLFSGIGTDDQKLLVHNHNFNLWFCPLKGVYISFILFVFISDVFHFHGEQWYLSHSSLIVCKLVNQKKNKKMLENKSKHQLHAFKHSQIS